MERCDDEVTLRIAVDKPPRRVTPLQAWRERQKLDVRRELAQTLIWPDLEQTEAPGSLVTAIEDPTGPTVPPNLGSPNRRILSGHGLAPQLVDALSPIMDAVGTTFRVTSGARTPSEQRALIAQGKTTTVPSMSRHVPCAGFGAEAVDLAALDPISIEKLGAATWGTPVKWGGDWTSPEPWHFYIELTQRPCVPG